MKKSDLIAAVATRANTTHSAAEDAVNLIFDQMKQALLKGDRIELRGFGSLAVRDYDGYIGRNPRTGQEVEVKPKRLPVFRAGKEMARRING